LTKLVLQLACYVICPLIDHKVVGCVFAIEIEQPLHVEGCPA